MSRQESASDRVSHNEASDADRAHVSRDARIPARVMVAGLIFVILAVVATLVAIRFVLPNRIPELTEVDLEKAEKLWESAGPASYDMDLEIRGARPGHVHVEVRSGEVTAMSRDGHVPPQRTWYVWSVPGQFETLERELELAEDPEHEMQATVGTQLHVRCEFHPKFGFPRRFHRHVTGGGPEVYWRVTRFAPK